MFSSSCSVKPLAARLREPVAMGPQHLQPSHSVIHLLCAKDSYLSRLKPQVSQLNLWVPQHCLSGYAPHAYYCQGRSGEYESFAKPEHHDADQIESQKLPFTSSSTDKLARSLRP